MDNREQLRRITELTEQIAGLPKGYLSKKTIGGKVYYYHQWSENGVKQSRYLHDSEIAPLADKIEKRKELQAQLALHYLVRVVGVDEATFRRYLRYGEEQGKLARSGARAEDLGILVGAERAPYEENTFPLMIQGELKELPLALILLPGEHEEMLRSEYLKTAAQAEAATDFFYTEGDSILYVPMDTFDQLFGAEQKGTVCLEIALDRDVTKTGEVRRADLNEVVYPGNAPRRAGEERKIREEIEALSSLSISSFDTMELRYYPNTMDEKLGEPVRTYMGGLLEDLRSYAEEFDHNSESLMLFGNAGLGKTHAALAIAGIVLQKDFDVIYVSSPDFFGKLENARFDSSEDAETLLRTASAADLLILDDLGTEFVTPYFITTFYSLLNNRLGAGLPTIVTTNIADGSLLEKRYTEKISSRLSSFVPCLFAGEDIRGLKAAE